MSEPALKNRIAAYVIALGGLILLLSAAICGPLTEPSFVGAQDKARSASVQANMNTVALDLETYYQDHEDRYPPLDTWLQAFRDDGKYRLHRGLPRAPWSRVGQSNVIPVPAEWLQHPPKAGDELGEGKVRQPDAPFDALSYGALIYWPNAKRDSYTLVGIGKRGKKAIALVQQSPQ